MAGITIQLEGLDKILKNITDIEQLKGINAAMLAGGQQVKSVVNVYPPATEANSPEQKRWYERGYGPRWRRKDGSIGGRKTSETLGRKWTVKTQDNGMSVVIGNNTSYGPFVQDEDRQADFHKRRGWKTIQAIGKDEAPRIVAFVQDYMRKKYGMS